MTRPSDLARSDRAASSTAVPSPCVSVCRIEPASGLCEGCLRTLDEIACWGSMNDGARRAVWRAIDERRALRGGATETKRT